MTAYEDLKRQLRAEPRCWLVTGVAGFIGSNLLEHLLRLDQRVVGLDNFSTGSRANLDEVRILVGEDVWSRFRFIEGDIRDPAACAAASQGADYVLHQAALGSVPRSIDNPYNTNDNNVTGTLNMMLAARDAKVRRFVYASSSAVYGDHPALPKVEEHIGRSLSPYAVSKHVCELYAHQVASHYGLECVGLRYFNVFGPRQDPDGPYAAVIPKWVAAMIAGEPVYINGTGETSRDFCFVENVVQVNLLAATGQNPDAVNRAYNVALNDRTSLTQLFELLRSRLASHYPHLEQFAPIYRNFRAGDVMHSQADIDKACTLLGYCPTHTIGQGLDVALDWYRKLR
ncbi:capsular polysaccharide biosynthesis protein [Geomonas limicola]|uniref:Capsular polysaccharide biosynthesis protein n=1 Tax=Geomonas limicola TaxID=2740186 RepID=A0A6V8N9F5_9BACT|nr:SDR family oxidoreductase [Geomonas limicola]GFO69212.1 capsular polysaccharide biosynthesis protein [Geomonas limicola]